MGNKVQRQENLVLAIQTGQESRIIQFMEKFQTADPDFINTPINKLGDTLLHYAAYKKLTSIVKKALSLGANATIKNGRGLTPVEVIDDEDVSNEANAIRSILNTSANNWLDREMEGEIESRNKQDSFLIDQKEDLDDYLQGGTATRVIVTPDDE